MFTTGQIIFAVLFVIAFIVIMIYSYSGDNKLHKKQYKGSLWILLGFLVFIGVLVGIKFFMKS